jgi:uncharacterized coiled-coil protein SlyX
MVAVGGSGYDAAKDERWRQLEARLYAAEAKTEAMVGGMAALLDSMAVVSQAQAQLRALLDHGELAAPTVLAAARAQLAALAAADAALTALAAIRAAPTALAAGAGAFGGDGFDARERKMQARLDALEATLTVQEAQAEAAVAGSTAAISDSIAVMMQLQALLDLRDLVAAGGAAPAAQDD